MKKNLSQIEDNNIQMNYYENIVQINVCKKTIKDMEMYIAQLEKTMLDYHSSKMNEINKIITDTWKEIYDGIDIRNIEIKSSEDEN